MKPTDTSLADFYGVTRQTISNYKKGTQGKKRLYKAMLEYFKINNELIDNIIENDFRRLVNLSGEEFSENDKNTLEELKNRNRNRLKEHLENNLKIENFCYE